MAVKHDVPKQTQAVAPAGGARTSKKLIFGFIGFVLLLVSGFGIFVYVRYVPEYRRKIQYAEQMPYAKMDVISQGLKTFYLRTGRFPATLKELDDKVWNHDYGANISPDGKKFAALKSNYLYVYHRASETTAVIWGVPTGERRTEAAAFLWYISPQADEKWMGPALPADSLAAIESIPSETQLHVLQMTRQRPETMMIPKKSTNIFSILFGN